MRCQVNPPTSPADGGVVFGRTLKQDAAEFVSALGLDHSVRVPSGDEAWTEGDDCGGLVDSCAEITFRDDRVDQQGGPEVGQRHSGIMVDDHGDGPSCKDLVHVMPTDSRGVDILDTRASVVDGLRKGHRPPHGGGVVYLSHDDRAARAMETDGDAGRKITGAFDEGARPRSWVVTHEEGAILACRASAQTRSSP